MLQGKLHFLSALISSSLRFIFKCALRVSFLVHTCLYQSHFFCFCFISISSVWVLFIFFRTFIFTLITLELLIFFFLLIDFLLLLFVCILKISFLVSMYRLCPVDNRPSTEKPRKFSYFLCDRWHLTHDTWYMTYKMWHWMVNIGLKCQVTSSKSLEIIMSCDI